jgi:uncharacterized protein (TIGR03435 family)
MLSDGKQVYYFAAAISIPWKCGLGGTTRLPSAIMNLMRGTTRHAAILLTIVVSLGAQTFEVASVKRSAQQSGHGLILVRPGQPVDPERINWTSVSLKSVVMAAWRVGPDQVAGPQWIEDERYDVTAKLPTGASQDQMPAMLQNLLADRWHLIAHTERRPRLMYALTVAKGGPKLKAAAEKPASEPGEDHIQAMNTTVATFAGLLSGWLHHPVLDETGIQGKYDITLHVAVADLNGMGSSESSIFNAVQELGLKVESRSVPDKFVVVDKADRIPTEN